MMKIFNNIFKWFVLVLISYSTIFTCMTILEKGGIAETIAYKIDSMEEIAGIEEACKYYQELADEAFSNNSSEDYLDMSEEERNKQKQHSELYERYPAGYSMIIKDVVILEAMSNLHITSLAMGIAVGTAIYMMLDKDKKDLKVIISLYIIFVILLGFVEGIQSVSGENLKLIDKWIFPQTFIIPVTAVFILAVIVRITKQKDIAKQLNIKLQEKKNNKSN